MILVPTELERAGLSRVGGFDSRLGSVELCGFGPVLATARAGELIARMRPLRVLLAGVAGTYDLDRAPLGAALEFKEVALDGVGAGEGESFLPSSALGFSSRELERGTALPSAGERMELASSSGRGLLLTVCSSSAGEAMAARRRERHPEAVAEDMEGFGVAAACALAGVPLRIVRGISNAAGDRDRGQWRLGDALSSARMAALSILEAWR